jgi:hypothetical protein
VHLKSQTARKGNLERANVNVREKLEEVSKVEECQSVAARPSWLPLRDLHQSINQNDLQEAGKMSL